MPVGGSIIAVSTTDYRRNNFFGLTGTYYDKDLTDIVYRYDFLYQPESTSRFRPPLIRTGRRMDRVHALDHRSRPSDLYSVDIEAAHLPDRAVDRNLVSRSSERRDPASLTTAGKVARAQHLGFMAATNWLMNGQLTAGNVFLWDIDDNVGELSTTNVYRYSRNMLFGVNAQWFIGRSGRFTDPYLLSRQQRFNELEFTFTYEI